MLTFTPVTSAAQITFISNLAFQIFPKLYGSAVSIDHVNHYLNQNQTVSAIQQQLKEGYTYSILSVKNKEVGYLGYYFSEDALFLSKLYFDEHQRGKGFGTRAMDFLMSEAKSHGKCKIELIVVPANKSALDFYLKAGFECTEKSSYTSPTGERIENWKMIFLID